MYIITLCDSDDSGMYFSNWSIHRQPNWNIPYHGIGAAPRTNYEKSMIRATSQILNSHDNDNIYEDEWWWPPLQTYPQWGEPSHEGGQVENRAQWMVTFCWWNSIAKIEYVWNVLSDRIFFIIRKYNDSMNSFEVSPQNRREPCPFSTNHQQTLKVFATISRFKILN